MSNPPTDRSRPGWDSGIAEGYFVAIGSNIAPERQLPVVLAWLCRRFRRLWVSSVIRTEPHGMNSERDFLNAVCFVPTDLPQPDLKQQLVELEERLGRDRSDPLKKIKDRAADLDILLRYPGHGGLDRHKLPHEPYIAPMFRELASSLGLLETVDRKPAANATAIPLEGCVVGTTPMTLQYTAQGSFRASSLQAI